MPFEPLFCDRCQESIPDADVESGKAIRLGGKVLHVPCAFRRAMPGPGRTLTFLLALVAAGGAAFGVMRVLALERDRRAQAAAASPDDVVRAVARLEGQIRAGLADNRAAVDGEVKRLGVEVREAMGKAQADTVATLRAETDAQGKAALSRFEVNEARMAAIADWVKEVRDRAMSSPAPAPVATPPTPPAPTPAAAPPVVEPTPVAPPASPAPPPPAGDAETMRRNDAELEKWVQVLKSPDPSRSFSATYKLKDLKDLRAVGPLVETLKNHKDYYTRLGAATALGELKACDAVPALIDALDDRDELVRVAAGEAIATIRGEATKPLVGLSKKEIRAVRDELGRWWKEAESTIRQRLNQPAATKP